MQSYRVDGRQLRKNREEKRLSRADLAEKAGCSDKTIIRAEMGEKLKIDSIDRIASVLEIKPSEIIDEPVKEIPKSQYASFATLSLLSSSSDFLYIVKKGLNNISEKQRLPDNFLSGYSQLEKEREDNLRKKEIELKELEWSVFCPINNEAAALISSIVTSCRKFLQLDWAPDDPLFVEDSFTGETADILRLGLIADNIEKLKKDKEQSIYVHGGTFIRHVFNESRSEGKKLDECVSEIKVFRIEFSKNPLKSRTAQIHRGVYKDLEDRKWEKEQDEKMTEASAEENEWMAQEQDKRLHSLTEEEKRGEEKS